MEPSNTKPFEASVFHLAQYSWNLPTLLHVSIVCSFFHRMDGPQFINLAAEEHLDCFQLGAIMNKAAVIIHV